MRCAFPPNAQSGQKMRLRGRGLPGQTPGDQYIQLKVVVPPANSPEAQRGVRGDEQNVVDSIRVRISEGEP